MNALWNAPISDRFSSLCARVFSPAAAILESEKTLGTRLAVALTDFYRFCKGSVCVEVLTSFYGRFVVEEGQFIKYTPSTSSLHFGSHFIHLLTRPRFGAESSGSQPGYRKLFPHGPHSSKNNFFGIKISQRRDWECPSLSYYGS